MEIRILQKPISEEDAQALAKAWYGHMVKGVGDVEREVVALGGEWHMDANTKPIEHGSHQEHLWGFTIYPGERGDTAIEYISLINIRPAQGNRSLELKDETLRTKIRSLVARYVPHLGV